MAVTIPSLYADIVLLKMFNSPILSELQKNLTDEDYSIAVGFCILLRAVDRFATNNNRFPGLFDGAVDEDISRLKTIAVGILSDLGCNGSTLTDDLIGERHRFTVVAVIVGIASQEVTKLICSCCNSRNG
ncbi:hypothetical protein MKX03_035641 [Papaver bracteatum]|nr:hypothetical protein MKX03_035641 [Papaver bracteatum]